MQSSRKSIIRVVLLCLGLMILAYFHAYFGRQKITVLLSFGYMLITSFLLTKFYEKRSIIERFGFQRNNALGLLFVTYLGLLVVYYFDTYDITAIFLAPLFEEIFFRGYMLGTLCNTNEWKWRLIDLGWIIITSLLFALSHVFRYYPNGNILVIFVSSLSYGFLYVRLRTILWCFLAHMVCNLSIPFGTWHLYFYILTIFSIIILLTYLLKLLKGQLEKNIRNTDVSSKFYQK